jgi:hypothetical protein
MPLIQINLNPSRRELRQFAAGWFPAFFAIVGGLVLYHTRSLALAGAVWAPAALLAVAGFFMPTAARWVYVGWMVAAYPIGWLVSHLLLAMVYYGVLTPIGLAMRLCGRDPLCRNRDPSATTYWVPRDKCDDPERYFRQF